MSVLIWTQIILFLKEFFEKINFEKKSADDNKSMNKYTTCKELNRFSHDEVCTI